MFERRLVILLWCAVLCAAGLIARLFQLQILQANDFKSMSESALERPPETLYPLRGRILDRNGVVLVSDEPAYDVTVHYGILSMDPDYLHVLARRARREPALRDVPSTQAARRSRELVRERLAAMWVQLSRASGVPTAELRARRDDICRRVEALRSYLWRARASRGFEESPEDVRLAEDQMRHAVLRDVSPAVRAAIELQVADPALLRIEPSVRREARDVEPVCHLIGRLGEVSARQMELDPARDDERRRYLPGEMVGVSGVERAAESILRGERGMRQKDLDGHVLQQSDARDGQDIRLTIDIDLQRKIAEILKQTVAAHPPSTGAACVVIDVRTREVLALVSVPEFGPHVYGEHYNEWRDDTRYRPLLFRAVAEEYPPGSILKPAALLAGLSSGLINPSTVVECRGRLFENVDAWFCWTQWRDLPPHGPVTAVDAIQHSCNIYFYTLGQRVGAARLTDFYRAILRGPVDAAAGLDLVEERRGFIPTEEELKARRGSGFQVTDARNYALGQGEIQITPLQAANLFATLARGKYREPTLIRDDGLSRPESALPGVRASDFAVVREGLYRCVNQPGGTAYEGARMEDMVVCGKTGSAQAVPRVSEWKFTFASRDGRIEELVAPTREAAEARLDSAQTWELQSRRVANRWPPAESGRGKDRTHAWFAGFAPREDPRLALALVIEYGGSGGKVAAPVGRRIFELLMDSPAGYLPRDAALEGRLRRPIAEPVQDLE